MDINQIVNTAGVIIAGLLTFWFLGATKRDNQRKKNKKK
jgi:plastocyanin domain-containing protein